MSESSTEQAISVAIGSLSREDDRHGTQRIRTLFRGDVVMATLDHVQDCFTTVEHMMIAGGEFPKVRQTRAMLGDWSSTRLVEIVEQATSRKVRASFSQVSHNPDIAVELFLLHPAGFESDLCT